MTKKDTLSYALVFSDKIVYFKYYWTMRFYDWLRRRNEQCKRVSER